MATCSAHTWLQHILLLLIVPALLLLSLPRSLSLAWRPRALRASARGLARRSRRDVVLARADAVQRGGCFAPIHGLQTVSLLVLGSVFWRQILAPREEERLSPPGAVLYLFSACVACSVLGIIITFSPVTVCSIYAMPAGDRLGMLPNDSTRLGIYAGARPADRRTAHVGADVFDLFERDLRPNCALVRAKSASRVQQPTTLMEQEYRTIARRLGAAPARTSSAPQLISRPDWRWEQPSFSGG